MTGNELKDRGLTYCWKTGSGVLHIRKLGTNEHTLCGLHAPKAVFRGRITANNLVDYSVGSHEPIARVHPTCRLRVFLQEYDPMDGGTS